MRSLSLLTLCLATIGAYSKPTVRAPCGLEVSLSTPAKKVVSASEIVVVATVKNVGDKDLNVIKFGAVLDNQPLAHPFIVTKDGKEVPFIGTKAPIPTGHLSNDNWVVIHAGDSLATKHNVSAAYNFSTSGAGTYTFKSTPKLQVIGLNGTVETISDINVDNTRTVSITVTDNLSKRQFNPNDPFKVNCNDDKKHVTIAYGLAEAKELASIAAAYIDHDQGKSQVYKDYFGSNPTSSVIKNFAAIAKVDVVSSKISLYCSDPSKICSPGNAAYFLGSEGVTHLHFCDAFFRYHPRNELCKNGNTVDDQNILGGATLFELSYGLLSTDDIAHRCPDGRNLGNKDKIKNAANYECFATEIYKRTKC